jgi:hypothetical protein
MLGRREVRVEGTVIKAEGPSKNFTGPTNIILDVHTSEGKLVRVAFKQQLGERRLLTPEAGDVVAVDWDPKRGSAHLALKGDARYDMALRERQQKDAFNAEANAPAGTPPEAQDKRVEELRAQVEDLKRKAESGALTKAEVEEEKQRLLGETHGIIGDEP